MQQRFVATRMNATYGAISRLSARLAAWAATASTWRLSLLAAIVALAMCLPGFFSIPPVDRDEARFAQATKQMMESGDYVDIRLQDEARHKKPVGIYWLQAGAAMLLGQGADAPIWVYRLPSLIGIAVSAGLATAIAATFLGGSRALLVGLLVASAILPGVEARLAKTDAVLLATILAFHLGIARGWVARRPGGHLSWILLAPVWLAMGVGILVKGPIAPLVAGLTVLALSATARDLRWIGALRPASGLLLALIVAAPWFVAIGLRTDGAFFVASAGEDLLGKAVSGQESHGAPPGVHLLAMVGTFWPLSALILLALPALRRRMAEPAVVFALCWAVPTWALFELVPTKLPHYVLPILPAVALLAVAVLRDTVAGPRWAALAARTLLSAVPAALCVALIGAAAYIGSASMLAGAAILLAAAVLAWHGTDVSVGGWTWRASLVAFLTYLGTFPFGLAGFGPVWISPALADAVRDVEAAALEGCPQVSVLLAGFREPSAVFLLGTETRFLDGAATAEALGEDPCAVALVEGRQDEAFRAVSLIAKEWTRVEGVNLNGGDALSFGVYVLDR